MIRVLATTIHKTMAVFDGAKWIAPKSLSLNGVNIIKVRRADGFTKLCIGLVFFAMENRLILL